MMYLHNHVNENFTEHSEKFLKRLQKPENY